MKYKFSLQDNEVSLPKTWWNSAFSIPKRHFLKWKKEKRKLWVVSYDVADAKRLRKAASICLDHGARQQHSVYECFLTNEKFLKFFLKISSSLDPEKDSLVAYPIHGSRIESIRTFGKAKMPKLYRQMVF